jgi:hypothetical protein
VLALQVQRPLAQE